MARSDARIQFDALAIEGGLFTADWLVKIASFGAPMQTEADYGVRAGFTLREEIALAWRAAQALWAQFAIARSSANHDAAAVSQRFSSELLKQTLGFSLHAATAPQEADGRLFPIGRFAFDGTVPVVIGSHAATLDESDPFFGDSSGERIRRRSAFGLVQEYLNARNGALWGIAMNGLVLRIARDNSSLTRPAWFEADLERLFTEERFAEFSVLWLVAHASRFGSENVAPVECVLERWRDACREQGVTARGALRRGVEQALLDLGTGFLAHPANMALRDSLANGQLTTRNYFQQLLRLVYRQIFLLTVEERGILHREDSAVGARELYAEGYALRRLRDRAVRRNAHDRHYDLWEGLKLVWQGLARGEPRLALPALAGLFAEEQCPDLVDARLENRHLLRALFNLAWLRDQEQPNSPLARVNWRDMGPEELGSIYESLLELEPQVSEGSRGFSFLEGRETRGNARKTSGSYYTPDSLVQVLLDFALDPVIAEKLRAHPAGEQAADALLSITVVDPACGSGHFLLAAARRIATHLARVFAENAGAGQPTPADYRHALRAVVGRCIFGVDLNPMAVELCKVSLWLEGVEPGFPLTFLNSHIQPGNALLGTTPALMANGIPDAAWDPIEGDDKKIANALKKRNRSAAAGQRSFETLWSNASNSDGQAIVGAITKLDGHSDTDLATLTQKEALWSAIITSSSYLHQKFVADTWCSAFVWIKQLGNLVDIAPTNDIWRQVCDQIEQPSVAMARTVERLAEQFQFFHWFLQFPQVFEKGGFDIVLGNPPWDELRPEDKDFFAARAPEIAGIENRSKRKSAIKDLAERRPILWQEWQSYSRQVLAACHLIHGGGRFIDSASGNLSTHNLFFDLFRQLLRPGGRAGIIVPSGLATNEGTSKLFGSTMRADGLRSFYDFENRQGFFPSVHRSARFALVVLGHDKEPPLFAFFLEKLEDLGDRNRVFPMTHADLARVNPNTLTCPTFRSRRSFALVMGIHDRCRVIIPDSGQGDWAAAT